MKENIRKYFQRSKKTDNIKYHQTKSKPTTNQILAMMKSIFGLINSFYCNQIRAK